MSMYQQSAPPQERQRPHTHGGSVSKKKKDDKEPSLLFTAPPGTGERMRMVIALFFVMIASGRLFLYGASASVVGLHTIGIVGDLDKISQITLPGVGWLTFWHLVGVAFSALEIAFMPYRFVGFRAWGWLPLFKIKVHPRMLVVDDKGDPILDEYEKPQIKPELYWMVVAWWIVFVFDIGTNYAGIQEWLSHGVLIPVFGGVALAKEGIPLIITATFFAFAVGFAPDRMFFAAIDQLMIVYDNHIAAAERELRRLGAALRP